MIKTLFLLVVLACVGAALAKPVKATLRAGDETECAICKVIVYVAEKELLANSTQEDIEHFLENDVCALLPGSLRSGCDDIVASYLPELAQFVKNEESPEQACQQVELCPPPKQLPVGGALECYVCEFLVKEIDEWLAEPTHEKELDQVLDDACKVLHYQTIVDLCDSFVNAESENIISYVEAVGTQGMCLHFHMCENNRTVNAVASAVAASAVTTGPVVKPGVVAGAAALAQQQQQQQQHKKPHVVGVSSAWECSACESLVAALDTILTDNRTEAAIERALDLVCDLVGPFKEDCEALVNANAPSIIEYIVENEGDPKGLCEHLDICPKTNAGGKGRPLSRPGVVVNKPTTTTATTNNPPGSAVECTVCKLVIDITEAELGSGATQQAIESALDGICGKLDHSFAEACKGFVNEYEPELVQWIQNDQNGTVVCTDINLCSGNLTMPIHHH